CLGRSPAPISVGHGSNHHIAHKKKKKAHHTYSSHKAKLRDKSAKTLDGLIRFATGLDLRSPVLSSAGTARGESSAPGLHEALEKAGETFRDEIVDVVLHYGALGATAGMEFVNHVVKHLISLEGSIDKAAREFLEIGHNLRVDKEIRDPLFRKFFLDLDKIEYAMWEKKVDLLEFDYKQLLENHPNASFIGSKFNVLARNGKSLLHYVEIVETLLKWGDLITYSLNSVGEVYVAHQEGEGMREVFFQSPKVLLRAILLFAMPEVFFLTLIADPFLVFAEENIKKGAQMDRVVRDSLAAGKVDPNYKDGKTFWENYKQRHWFL
ncbi:MAG: hypothetical protein WAN62_04325, partial [Candidatus Acidiferrum sp.]